MTSLLIVDDDEAFRTTIGRDLAEHGYKVRLAQNADEAESALSSETIDIMLTDLRMPGDDGIDLLARVRSLSARTRTILMSGYASARDYQRAIECGAVRVLCKPFTSSELLLAIRQAIDCETGFRGSIHGLSLVDLLQMFHYARRSLAIVVDGWSPGHVYLEEGRVIHATYRAMAGEQALCSILAMPAGSLRTMVLPDGVPHTIERPLENVLLDAMRVVDERIHEHGDSWDISGIEQLGEPEESISARPRMQIFVERLRRVDGYLTACLVDSVSGVILGVDGDYEGFDLQGAVACYCELYRTKCAVARAFVPDDRVEDIVITYSTQFHVLHALTGQPTCFLYGVFARSGTIAMVTRAFAAAEAAFDA
ncbi:MAG: response regulator [Kofleriaceae bacterium]